jgi:hypothetical protein
MGSDTVPRRLKGPPTESDLSQVMAHGPALCQAYGRFWGAVLMIIAITKARRGPLGYATIITVLGGAAYHWLSR